MTVGCLRFRGTLATFVNETKSECFWYLEQYLKYKDAKITKETYFKILEETGGTPDPNKTPVEYEDLPMDCQLAVAIYSRLGNRVYPDIGFIGKDYTLLPMLLEFYEIYDLEFLIDMLNMLDAENIEQSQKSIKKSLEDMKRKR